MEFTFHNSYVILDVVFFCFHFLSRLGFNIVHSPGQCWVLQVCLLDCKLDPEHDFPLHLGDGLLHILDRDLVSVGALDPSVRQSA